MMRTPVGVTRKAPSCRKVIICRKFEVSVPCINDCFFFRHPESNCIEDITHFSAKSLRLLGLKDKMVRMG